MKILALTTTYPRYEGDTYPSFVHEFTKPFIAEGHSVEVVAPSDDEGKCKEEIEGIKVHRFNYFFPRKLQRLVYRSGGIPEQVKKSLLAKIQLPLFIICFFFKVLALIMPDESKDKLKYDIIYAHWSLSAVIGGIIKKMYGIPMILVVRENDINMIIKNKILLWGLKQASLVVTTVPEEVEILKKYNPNTKHIYLGVHKMFRPIDNEDCNKTDCRIVCGLDLDKTIIIFTGHIIYRKGVDKIFKLAEKYKDILFLFVGDGDLKQESHDNLLFVGNKQYKDLPLWYNSADIFLFPSRSDTLPNVIKEAMGCGLPCIIDGNIGGVKYLADNGINAYLPENDEEIELAFNELITNKNLRERFGKLARQKIVDLKITWEDMAKKYITESEVLLCKK